MNEHPFRIDPFVQLGEQLVESLTGDGLTPILEQATAQNSWFTADSIRSSLTALHTEMLTPDDLATWLKPYTPPAYPPRSVGVIAAGNIPLVGFFDLLCVLVCGHACLIKPSSKDYVLMEWIVELLRRIDPTLPVALWDGNTPAVDALIATGSDNTNRYFRTQYPAIPRLLRGSRTSIAMLAGSETPQQLAGLGEDLFAYGGLGCRNVTHLFVPHDYDVERLATALALHPMIHPKYQNAYRQTRALHLLQGVPIVDGKTLLLREGAWDRQTPGEITYTRYTDPVAVQAWITEQENRIQCIVSGGWIAHPRRVDFGRAQHPRPGDYPDGVDVIEFLYSLENNELHAVESLYTD